MVKLRSGVHEPACAVPRRPRSSPTASSSRGRRRCSSRTPTDPAIAGSPNFTTASMNAVVGALADAGFSVHIHAIGDGGVRTSLDAFEKARAARKPGLRHQIAHLELIDPQDIPRFRDLDVIANFEARGLRRRLHRRPHVAGPRRKALAVALSHRQRGEDRGRAFHGERLVGLVRRPDSMPSRSRSLARGWRKPKRPPMVAEEAIDLATPSPRTPSARRTRTAWRRTRAASKWERPPTSRRLSGTSSRFLRRRSPGRRRLTLLDGKVVYEDPALK